MDVFDLDRDLVSSYAQFARSFTKIRAADIRRQVDEIYATNRFWPEPLISINPHFEHGQTIGELVASGVLHPDTGKVFRIDGEQLRLFRHQTQATAKAHAKQSFVVTTGTGSGKSMCFFVPIVDAAIKAKAKGEAPRTRAIVIYPMNALANSQMKELQKFIDQSGLPPERRPTFARYTGQETEAERADIRALKPDILLTNFMMLELLMTRQDEQNRAVIDNARGLNFIVLDELHTYRGRQGADVAMLVRRLKDRVCGDLVPVCIGTSATMASEGGHEHRAAAVAQVASRLFGADVPAEAVIDESLVRATDEKIKPHQLTIDLQKAVNEPIPADLDNAKLKRHPLAAWIELEVGLNDGQKLSRREPITITAAAERLVAQTGRPLEQCAEQIRTMLNLMSRPETERGGISDRAFLAFKLHQFISGAGFVHTTLHDPSKRHVTVEGQRFDPRDPGARLYSTFFCRSCGQEHHPVSIATTEAGRCVLPRSIDDTPIEDEESDEDAGYLMLEPVGDTEYAYDGSPESMPEDWTEPAPGGALRIRSNRRRMVPQQMLVHPSGLIGEGGRAAWFSPGRFKFCPACRHQPAGQAREINKVASLSAEGRSSTTTILVSAALRWMNEPGRRIKADKRKLLGFTDNRQDAALQAGHFNDFIFVTLHGMTLCKLFASRLLSTPWLLHLDVFRQTLNVNNLGRSRPDLVGEDDHGNWHAFESKGRSSVPSAGDKDKAKDQAQRLVAVGGLSTQLHVGSFAFFRNGILEFFWRDPEPVADEPLNVPAPNEEWRYYYEPALRLASKMEGDALAAERTLADVTVEIQHEILAMLSEGAWLKAKKIAQERSSSLVAEGYQPDGIKVRAGDSWRKPYESIERG